MVHISLNLNLSVSTLPIFSFSLFRGFLSVIQFYFVIYNNKLIKMSCEYDPELLQELLPIYYKRLFPHQAFYRWLSYGLCNILINFFVQI